MGRPSRGFFGWAALVGLFLGGFQWCLTYSQRVVEASLLLPTYSGATTVLATLIGVCIFKDRLTRRTIPATVVGIAAILVFGFAK
jgi:multidrug transporter EmrE-like cation transporter